LDSAMTSWSASARKTHTLHADGHHSRRHVDRHDD
jgi:hypothetical protein